MSYIYATEFPRERHIWDDRWLLVFGDAIVSLCVGSYIPNSSSRVEFTLFVI